MKLALYNPLREKDVFDGEETEPYGQTDRSASMRVEGKPVGEENTGVQSDDLLRAGHLLHLGRRRRRRRRTRWRTSSTRSSTCR